MADMGAIGKDSRNSTQGWNYRGVDAVMNALSPLCNKHKLIIVPEVLEQIREERVNNKGTVLIYTTLKIKYSFIAEDGSSVCATVIGEGMDSGDKSSNKAMSVGFKYACFQVFCIPTEEMIDPDQESHEVKPKQAQADQKTLAELMGQMKILIKKTNYDESILLHHYKVESLSDMDEKQIRHCIAQLSKGVKDEG